MSVSLRLDIKQTQGLVLTPQLQQAIKLLQYSNQELLDAVQHEAVGNPFIQVVEPAGVVSTSANGSSQTKTSSELGATAQNGKENEQADYSIRPKTGASDHSLSLRSMSNGRHEDGLPSAIDRLTDKPSLLRHVQAQLMTSRADRKTTQLARMLAEQLDGDGYLRTGNSEIANFFSVELENVEVARALLQSCDPTGVGARDLAECLALQLAELDRLDPAMRKLLDRLPQLARADWLALERACGVDREDLEEMVQEIKSLDPRPGAFFASNDIDTVIPDMFVSAKAGGGWRVELNTRALPRVLVDESYAADIGVDGQETKEFIQEKLQAANWLQKALEQRASTMIRVAAAIFQRQKGFLDRGAQGLKPLVLRDIAAATNLHESTISRATAEKFVQTPLGTFPLKYFFTAAIQSAVGDGDHSAEAIRMKIRDMIASENPQAILSDDQIVNLLREQGVMIARRTVAKYRESLKLPSSVQRRRAKSLNAS